MKKIFGLLSVAAVLTMLASCNNIKEEERKKPYEGTVSGERFVLLEDFTGVRCINCPSAAEEIHRLQEFFGENLIVVGMYPMNPAGLTTPYNPNLDQDLRTDIAQTYATEFAIEQFPNGLVNRGEVLGYKSWAGAVASAITASTNYANMSGNAYFNEDLSQISVAVSGSFVEDYKEDGEINVIVMVVEDSIVARQLTPTEGVKADYVHNHVLRTVISAPWGDRVAAAAPSRGTAFAADFKGALDPKWRTEHLSVVAALVNAQSREVIQAAHIEIGK